MRICSSLHQNRKPAPNISSSSPNLTKGTNMSESSFHFRVCCRQSLISVGMWPNPDHYCVRFDWYPTIAICLWRIHVTGLTCWQDEVLPFVFDKNMSSHFCWLATVVYLAYLRELSSSVFHPVLLPIVLLRAGSYHMRYLITKIQPQEISVVPSHG